MTAPQNCPVCGSEVYDDAPWYHCSNDACGLFGAWLEMDIWSRLLLAPAGMKNPVVVERRWRDAAMGTHVEGVPSTTSHHMKDPVVVEREVLGERADTSDCKSMRIPGVTPGTAGAPPKENQP